MRQIGLLSDQDLADRFADHLRAEGVACSVDKGSDGFRLWVYDDDQVPAAKEELQLFQADPTNDRYRDASRRAMARFREVQNQQKQARSRTVNLSDQWSRPAADHCPITFGLIALSLVVAFFTVLNPQHDDWRVDLLWISNDGTLQPILHGEVWRLITPIFLHFGPMHLIFNLMGLQQFGMMIEHRKGNPKYLLMVLLIAALSNLAQFWFHGPNFGGMSGVVYGLFGYLWVKGKLEPESGFALHPQTITMMLVWHVLCSIGVVGGVANWAHGVGLVTGVALAMINPIMKPFTGRK